MFGSELIILQDAHQNISSMFYINVYVYILPLLGMTSRFEKTDF